MLSIFLCVYWPSACLWRNICLGLLTIFLIGLFVFLILHCISCLYILEVNPLPVFLVCNYFLPCWGLSFPLVSRYAKVPLSGKTRRWTFLSLPFALSPMVIAVKNCFLFTTILLNPWTDTLQATRASVGCVLWAAAMKTRMPGVCTTSFLWRHWQPGARQRRSMEWFPLVSGDDCGRPPHMLD